MNTNPSVKKGRASVFELNGIPSLGQALPLAMQHVVAMIVGCVTPSIIVAGVAGVSPSDRVILIQAALFCSAISTLLQLFPFIRFGNMQLGSALPVILGISFAYVPSMQAIAGTYDIATILGAQVVGSGSRWCRRHHCRLLHPEDPCTVSTSGNRNRGLYHRTFSVSDCSQLHGRRNLQRKLRFLAELAGSILHSGCCNGPEPLCQRIFKAGFHSDRYCSWIHPGCSFWSGGSFRRTVRRNLPASAAAAFFHQL